MGIDETVAGAGGGRVPAVRPYQLAGTEYGSTESLAAGLAEHWAEATAHLVRGDLQRWAAEDLGDQALADAIGELSADRSQTIEGRLFRLILRLAPGRPATYLGYPLTHDSLAKLAAEVLGDSPTHTAFDALSSAFRDRILSAYAESVGDDSYRELDDRWHEEFAAWKARVEEAQRAGAPEVFSTTAWKARAGILEALLKPRAESAVRERARASATGAAQARPWFSGLGNPQGASLGAALAMGDLVEAEAEAERRGELGPDTGPGDRRSRLIRRAASLAIAAALIGGGVVAFMGGGGAEETQQAEEDRVPKQSANKPVGIVLWTAATQAEADILEAPEAGSAVVLHVEASTPMSIIDDDNPEWYGVRLTTDEGEILGWIDRAAVRILCQGHCVVG